MSSKDSYLVRGLIKNFENKGCDILYANYENYKKPESIMEQKPDVIAWDAKNEMYHFGVAAEVDEVEQSRINSKLNTLANLSMGVGKSQTSRIPLYLGVPFKSTKEVSEILSKRDVPDENIITVGVGLK